MSRKSFVHPRSGAAIYPSISAVGKEIAMLDSEQIERLFHELNIPAQRIAEGSPIDIRCPFEKLHTLRDERPSCRLWFDSYPHLHCFHVHCHEAIYQKNLYLRLLLTGTTEFPEDAPAIRAGPPADYA